jgi:hypothetical protein
MINDVLLEPLPDLSLHELRAAAFRSSTEVVQARAAAHLAIDRSRAAMAEADRVMALRWGAA